MSSTVDLASWATPPRLADELATAGDDLARIAAHARRWVCQGAGFEPSPLCLLRPLARVLDEVAEGFLALERVGVADLVALRDAVTATAADLAAVDTDAAARLPVVA